jgi:hypothetical protein
MKMPLASALTAIVLLPLQLSAQQALPKASAAEVITMTATVLSVDAASRALVLEGSNGGKRTIVAGPDVRNLAQVEPGDLVKVTYTQAVAIELKKGGSGIRSSTVKEEGARAKPGEKPSGTVNRRVTLTGTVEQVDASNRLVSVKGPKGNVVEVAVSKATMGAIKVGDQVDMVYSEALAVAVSANAK